MKRIEGKLSQFGSKPGLERMEKLMESLGNPQDELKVIMVGGTNGKGSTTSCISSILSAAGYRTGSYYSPHLIRYNERFRINGKEITDKVFEEYEDDVLRLFDRGSKMTEFEALTAIAYRYFADEKADFAVMEIGMGGEFDAVNIAKPEASIITNVELEHTEFLGDTIEQIVRTKAGIMKHARRRVTGCSGASLEALESLYPMRVLERDFFVEPVELNGERTVFDYLGKTFYHSLELPLLGRHQIDNAALAIAAIESLDETVKEDSVRKGLLDAQNPGRLQVISKEPLIVIDAAHNPAGIGALVTNISLFDYDRLIVVFGVMARKDWGTMLKIIGQHADTFIINQPKDKGAAESRLVAKESAQYCETVEVPDVLQSLEKAKSLAGKKDMILVCGSIYMLGELLG